jgi:SAM-dependent methyltransferase
VSGPALLASGDPRLDAAAADAGRVLVDVGCGDGRHTVRWAEREPEALVVGLDAETTRLDRTLASARRKRLRRLLFVTAAAEDPPPALLGRADEIAAIMPWGSLLDGLLGGDERVLASVLALGSPGAVLGAVVNVRPWDAPSSVDRKLAATPEPTTEHLEGLAKRYAELGWRLDPPARLTDAEARALGSTWASRVVSARASRLLRLRATRDRSLAAARGRGPARSARPAPGAGYGAGEREPGEAR